MAATRQGEGRLGRAMVRARMAEGGGGAGWERGGLGSHWLAPAKRVGRGDRGRGKGRREKVGEEGAGRRQGGGGRAVGGDQ